MGKCRIAESKPKSKQEYTTNSGHYKTEPMEATNLLPNETAQERPVVLIGVIPNGEIDLTEALQNVFDRHQDNPFFRFWRPIIQEERLLVINN